LKCWYGERLPAHPVDTRIPVDPVSFETFDWKPRAPEMHSRAEVEHQTGPYEVAVTAQIADWDPSTSSGDSADIEDATRQLVEFDKHAQRMLGTDNPALGPMTAILLRTESASSSQIEQLTTSAKPGRERALAQSILRNKGLVSSTAVPISAGLLVPVDRYFAALGAFRSGDAGPIIREFARASRIAAATGTKLVDDLVAQLGESRARLQGLRSDAAAWKVLPALVGQPAVNTKLSDEWAGHRRDGGASRARSTHRARCAHRDDGKSPRPGLAAPGHLRRPRRLRSRDPPHVAALIRFPEIPRDQRRGAAPKTRPSSRSTTT